MTIKEFVDKTGVSKRWARYILQGERRPGAKLAAKLEAVSGVPAMVWLYPEKYDNPLIKARAGINKLTYANLSG